MKPLAALRSAVWAGTLLLGACTIIAPATTVPVSPSAPLAPTATATGRPLSSTTAGQSVTPLPQSGPPDTIIVGIVRTADDANPVAGAIAIRGDQITAVGSADDIAALARPATETIHLGNGVTAVPGFIDSHEHRIGDRGYGGISDAAVVLGQAVRDGWTSLDELWVYIDLLDELNALDDAGALRVRVNAYLALASAQGEPYGDWYRAYQPRSASSDRLRLAGVKLHVDHGWGLGQSMYTQPELDAMLRQAHEAGWQVALHTVGYQAHDAVLTALEHAGISAADRPRIEHVIAIEAAEIGRMAGVGAIASVQFNLPGFAIDAPDWTPDVLPPDFRGMFRYRDLTDAGLHIAGSSDWPWITQQSGQNSPLSLLYQAVTRQAGDRAPADWMRGQELTIEQAFRALTIEGAYATFEEERKGSLAVGKLADMVILSADPFSVPIDEVPTIQVVATIIGGHVEYCAAGQESVCAGGAPPPPSQSSAALSFAGTWTGADADDGSQITLTISQAGNKLTAQFADSYSGTLEPPGYVGEGSGRATAAAAAALDFHLERHDGSTVNVTATLTLSADGQALTLAFPGSMPAELRR